VVRNTLSARLSTRVASNKEDLRLTLREVAYMLLATFGLGIATLLLSWSIKFSEQSHLENCRSLGRAGTLCGDLANDDQLVAPAYRDCATLGRAGRVCFEHQHE
jgi:hypothetical protein